MAMARMLLLAGIEPHHCTFGHRCLKLRPLRLDTSTQTLLVSIIMKKSQLGRSGYDPAEPQLCRFLVYGLEFVCLQYTYMLYIHIFWVLAIVTPAAPPDEIPPFPTAFLAFPSPGFYLRHSSQRLRLEVSKIERNRYPESV